MAEKKFSKLEIFEQRNNVGGVWNYNKSAATPSNLIVPNTAPTNLPDKSIYDDGQKQHVFISPVYEYLETNIPKSLMNYSDLPFPKEAPVFPPHKLVKQYIEKYSTDLLDFISLDKQVIDIRPDSNSYDSKWTVSARNLLTGKVTAQKFDAVIIANGHYNDPFVPDIKGLAEWNSAFPGSISHSKFFRNNSQFTNQKIIVVGNSASGVDLASQICEVSQHPLFISEKKNSLFSTGKSPLVIEVPEIVEFSIKDKSIVFADGRIERDVDAIVFCTGYLYSYPFLQSLSEPVVSDGSRARSLYEHIFYIPLPTLAFVGTLQRIVPFPVSEGQGAIIARVWSGRLTLPSAEKMREWEAKLIEERGDGKNFTMLHFPLDSSYINKLHAWSKLALPRAGLLNEGKGKIPPYWGEEKRWVRERFVMIKGASQRLGEKRHNVRTLEELGFDYQKWKSNSNKDMKAQI